MAPTSPSPWFYSFSLGGRRTFLSIGNLGNILGQSAILGVLAFGMTIVIIGGGSNVVTGGIDLSLAANMGLSAAIYAALVQAEFGDAVAVAAALGSGAAIGAVNAFSVVSLRILPLLATLAVMNIAAGLELVITQNTVIAADTNLLSLLSSNGVSGVPILAFVLLAVAAVAHRGRAVYTENRVEAVCRWRTPRLPRVRVTRQSAGRWQLCGKRPVRRDRGYSLRRLMSRGAQRDPGDMLLSIVVTALLGVVFSRKLVPTIGGTLLALSLSAR